MAATYNEELPTDRDKARAMLGDNAVSSGTTMDLDAALLSDEHINAVLALSTSFKAGVAFLADELAVTYAQEPDSVALPTGLSVRWSERVDAWTALATRLRAEAAADADDAARAALAPRPRAALVSCSTFSREMP